MKHILLVEDDPSIVAALTEFLTGEDFETVSAATQKEAERLLTQAVFDLLLVDLALSEGDGFGICAAAKQRGLPVIFLPFCISGRKSRISCLGPDRSKILWYNKQS